MVPGRPAGRVEAEPNHAKFSWTAGTGEAARWWIVQTLRKGEWLLETPSFRNQTTQAIQNPVEAMAVRAMTGSGVMGAPSVWSLAVP